MIEALTVAGKAYAVDYSSDDGVWTAVIDRSQGASCVAQGCTLDEARKLIAEALAAYLAEVAS